MAEYIEREAFNSALREAVRKYPNSFYNGLETARQIAQDFPAADVRPVVTCERCVYHVDCGYHYCNKWCVNCPDDADFFCAYGER